MKYAIVTGGARGLGLGIVRALLDEAVADQVAVIDRELAPAPKELADRIVGFEADVTDEDKLRRTVDAITARFGPHPDILCNNAGGGTRNWWVEERAEEWMSVELWRRFIDLNLNAVYLVTREVAPRMKEGGAICNTASIAGIRPTPDLAAYGTAKAAVIAYTKTLAIQLAPRKIRVNAVAPGLIYTKIWEDLGTAFGGAEERARQTFELVVSSMVPLGREQTADDIGRAVAFLCSQRAANITGDVMVVDGGIVLGPPRPGR